MFNTNTLGPKTWNQLPGNINENHLISNLRNVPWFRLK